MQKLITIIFGCVLILKAQPSFCHKFRLTDSNSSVEKLEFNWDSIPNQPWLAYNFWSNSFLGWEVKNGEVIAHPYIPQRRTAHITSHSIKKSEGNLSIAFKIKLFDKIKRDTNAIFGILIGAGDTSLSQKTNNFVFNTLSPGPCHLFGIKSNGDLILKDYHTDTLIFKCEIDSIVKEKVLNEIYSTGSEIRVTYDYNSKAIKLDLNAKSVPIKNEFKIGHYPIIPQGNIALFYDAKTSYTPLASFDDLIISGDVFELNFPQTATIGPVLSSFYTNTSDSLFLTAQLMPFKPDSVEEVGLLISGENFEDTYYGFFDSSSYQIRYRIALPKNFKKLDYRIIYNGKQSEIIVSKSGTIFPKPKNKKPKLMALNCNGFTFFHSGGIDYENLLYPYRQIQKGYEFENPDVVAFLGDQIYESRPESPIFKVPFCRLDYLYKWSIWCYAFRDITLNQPTIIMTDDHDVFQGNLWGNGGVEAQTKPINEIPDYYGTSNYDTWQQDHGGYFMGLDFVNMVLKSQTSHLPFPYDPYLKNGMVNYYTEYNYGYINLAILEDKKFKTPPAENEFRVYNGFTIDDNVTPKDYHKDNFKLLGQDQLSFLEKWANKPRSKKESKMILTQSAYASLTTVQIDYTPLKDRPAKRDSTLQKVSPDMDTNGWPKIGRDRALDVIGNNEILFISGDQHMGAVIDVYDSVKNPITFYSVPAIANTWPRMWWPSDSSNNPNYPLGKYTDAFGNKMNVKAVANPNPNAPYPNKINYKSPGFGIIEFNKKGTKAKLHAYPLYFDSQEKTVEFEGWPIKVKLK